MSIHRAGFLQYFTVSTCLVLAGLLLSPAAIAEGRAEKVIVKMDRDDDGKLSKREWRKKHIFDEVDLDASGYITLEELRTRFGESADREANAGGVEQPDEVSMSAIRRAGYDDVTDLKSRGLFETGLKPTWPENVECREIDEWYAKDYTPKRPKESYHGGIDIPAPFGTPIHSVMNGEVVALYEGKKNPRGIEVVMRHTPEESGLPLYVYTRYTHFDSMPKLTVGQRLNMGDVIGPIGNSGVLGCELTGRGCRPGHSRRPGLHFDILYSTNEKYFDTGKILVPLEAHWMDPNALYRKQMPVDSASMRALPESDKSVSISYRLDSGELYPPDTKMIWPYPCRKN